MTSVDEVAPVQAGQRPVSAAGVVEAEGDGVRSVRVRTRPDGQDDGAGRARSLADDGRRATRHGPGRRPGRPGPRRRSARSRPSRRASPASVAVPASTRVADPAVDGAVGAVRRTPGSGESSVASSPCQHEPAGAVRASELTSCGERRTPTQWGAERRGRRSRRARRWPAALGGPGGRPSISSCDLGRNRPAVDPVAPASGRSRGRARGSRARCPAGAPPAGPSTRFRRSPRRGRRGPVF